MTSASPSSDPGLADNAGPLKLDQHICFALYAASAMVTRLYRPLLQPLDLTYPQYLVMLLLWERAPRSIGELGEALRLDSATLTPLIKRLEANGHVTRQRDASDERRVLIEPTLAGRQLAGRATHIPQEMLCQLPVDARDLASLRSVLDKILATDKATLPSNLPGLSDAISNRD